MPADSSLTGCMLARLVIISPGKPNQADVREGGWVVWAGSKGEWVFVSTATSTAAKTPSELVQMAHQ